MINILIFWTNKQLELRKKEQVHKTCLVSYGKTYVNGKVVKKLWQ